MKSQLNVHRWSFEAIQRLQVCLDCTSWDIFLESSDAIDECTDVVTSYFIFCKARYSNQRPWFRDSLRQKVRARESAFQSGDEIKFKAAKYELRKAVKVAK